MTGPDWSGRAEDIRLIRQHLKLGPDDDIQAVLDRIDSDQEDLLALVDEYAEDDDD